MKWDSVLLYLSTRGGLDSKTMPPSIVVVNPDYPSECITWHTMLNPAQSRFLVNGYSLPEDATVLKAGLQSSTAPLRTGETSQTSDTSLKLKPAGRAVMAKSPQTPSRTEDTPSIPEASTSSVEKENGGGVEENIEGDELDAAIREAKETDDVVSAVDSLFLIRKRLIHPAGYGRSKGSTRLARKIPVHAQAHRRQ